MLRKVKKEALVITNSSLLQFIETLTNQLTVQQRSTDVEPLVDTLFNHPQTLFDVHLSPLQSSQPSSVMSEPERSTSRSSSSSVPLTARRPSSRSTGRGSSPPSPASATQPSTGKRRATGGVRLRLLLRPDVCLLTASRVCVRSQRRHHQHRREGDSEEDGRPEHLQGQQLKRRALAVFAQVAGVVCCLRYRSPSGGDGKHSSLNFTAKPNCCLCCLPVGKPKKGVIYPSTLDYVPSRPTYVKTSERRLVCFFIFFGNDLNLVQNI